jgi:hypothetical protein
MNLVLRVKLFLVTSLIWTAHPKEWNNLNKTSSNRIEWKEDQALNWESFKGKVPIESSLVAETNSGIHLGYTCTGETMDWNIYAYFDQELSWRKPHATKAILLHENLHFDISELYARKLRKRLHLLKHPCSMEKAELQKIFNEVDPEKATTIQTLIDFKQRDYLEIAIVYGAILAMIWLISLWF